MKNLYNLVTEIYKVRNSISPDVMRDISLFQENENCKLSSGTHLVSRNMGTAPVGKEMVSNLGAKLWPPLPEELKHASSLQGIENELKE